MPIRKLAQKLEQDLSYLCWQARIHGLTAEQLEQRFRKLADSYRQVVLARDVVKLEELLASGQATLCHPWR